MSRTSSWEGTQEQLVMDWEEIRRASACVSFSMPGAASTTRPPHAKELNSSCTRHIVWRMRPPFRAPSFLTPCSDRARGALVGMMHCG